MAEEPRINIADLPVFRAEDEINSIELLKAYVDVAFEEYAADGDKETLQKALETAANSRALKS